MPMVRNALMHILQELCCIGRLCPRQTPVSKHASNRLSS
jgi:hypothetical protein